MQYVFHCTRKNFKRRIMSLRPAWAQNKQTKTKTNLKKVASWPFDEDQMLKKGGRKRERLLHRSPLMSQGHVACTSWLTIPPFSQGLWPLSFLLEFWDLLWVKSLLLSTRLSSYPEELRQGHMKRMDKKEPWSSALACPKHLF
jgi:hypothetical protein